MVDHHAPAGPAGQREPVLPVGAAQPEQLQHLVGDADPVLPVRRPLPGLAAGLVGPVLRRPEHAAKPAHRSFLPFLLMPTPTIPSMAGGGKAPRCRLML